MAFFDAFLSLAYRDASRIAQLFRHSGLSPRTRLSGAWFAFRLPVARQCDGAGALVRRPLFRRRRSDGGRPEGYRHIWGNPARLADAIGGRLSTRARSFSYRRSRPRLGLKPAGEHGT